MSWSQQYAAETARIEAEAEAIRQATEDLLRDLAEMDKTKECQPTLKG